MDAGLNRETLLDILSADNLIVFSEMQACPSRPPGRRAWLSGPLLPVLRQPHPQGDCLTQARLPAACLESQIWARAQVFRAVLAWVEHHHAADEFVRLLTVTASQLIVMVQPVSGGVIAVDACW